MQNKELYPTCEFVKSKLLERAEIAEFRCKKWIEAYEEATKNAKEWKELYHSLRLDLIRKDKELSRLQKIESILRDINNQSYNFLEL